MTATVPRTLVVKRGDEIESKTELLTLSATDYKDIATGLMIQLARNAEKAARAREPASAPQLKWIFDKMESGHPAEYTVIEARLKALDISRTELAKLSYAQASEIIDAFKAAMKGVR